MSMMGRGRPSAARPGHRDLRGIFSSRHGGPDAFGSERSFNPGMGSYWDPAGPLHGYYIDFRVKAETPMWPPAWMPSSEEQMVVATAQWGLGCFERYVAGDGEEWLAAAVRCGEHLVDTQHSGGPQDGGWLHHFPMPHTYRIEPPWLSAIGQGEAASLLVRLHLETDDDSFAESARRALLPMAIPVGDGGLLAFLDDGSPFVEEYPTEPGSFVLNGALFALWGYRDVGVGLGDATATEAFDRLTTALSANLDRWDAGFWSRYDLYPHPIPNLATPSYHLLHIHQLEAMAKLLPELRFGEFAARFGAYRARPWNRRRALSQKVAFRLLVPRNKVFAHRLPWNSHATTATDKDLIVLCYHAVSPEWDAPLSVTPAAFDAQLSYLSRRGYRAVTVSEALGNPSPGRQVAITFDDGYRSVIECAKPILDRHGMVATLYVPTDYIGTERPMSWPGIDMWIGGPSEQELVPISWDEAAALRDAGWEIGAHTCSHPHLPELDDDTLRDELERSRRVCEERLGKPCESLAYPFGEFDRRVMAMARACGYANSVALGSDGGKVETAYRWPRAGVYNADDLRIFKLKASSIGRRMQQTVLRAPLGRILRALRARA
jgi:peptidoglycan/xylan/chitin deacetylase (PgdA/CDA1 family)